MNKKGGGGGLEERSQLFREKKKKQCNILKGGEKATRKGKKEAEVPSHGRRPPFEQKKFN